MRSQVKNLQQLGPIDSDQWKCSSLVSAAVSDGIQAQRNHRIGEPEMSIHDMLLPCIVRAIEGEVSMPPERVQSR